MSADAHLHLADPRLAATAPSLIAKARAAGVGRWLSVAGDTGDFTWTLALAAREPGLQTAFGLHPHQADRPCPELGNAGFLANLRRDAAAIGEIGLDRDCPVPSHVQETAFAVQLAIAADLDLPVVLHARGAWDRLIAFLDACPVRGMVHGFCGSREIGETLIRRGFYLSFGTALLFPQRERLGETLRALPRERLLFETDAPDQAPPGTSGNNLPENLPLVLAQAGAVLGMTPAEVARLSETNFLTLFPEKTA
jgi:TatD DNase family protein